MTAPQKSSPGTLGILALVFLAGLGIFGAHLTTWNQRDQRDAEDRLTALAAQTISEALGQVSFSGKYQARLLVKELQEKIPGVQYIALDTTDGKAWAHSDPSLIGRPLTPAEIQTGQRSVETQGPIVREYRERSGILVKEIAVPYRGGLYHEVQGALRVGLDTAYFRRDSGTFSVIFFGALGLLTLASLGILGWWLRRYTRDLLASRAPWDLVLELAPQALAVYDHRQRGIMVNRRFTELLGYTLQEVPQLDQWFQKAYPDPEYRRSIAKLWAQAVDQYDQGHRPFIPVQTRVQCRDGSFKVLEFQYSRAGNLAIASLTPVTSNPAGSGTPEPQTWDQLAQDLRALTGALGPQDPGPPPEVLTELQRLMHRAQASRPSLPEVHLQARDLSDQVTQVIPVTPEFSNWTQNLGASLPPAALDPSWFKTTLGPLFQKLWAQKNLAGHISTSFGYFSRGALDQLNPRSAVPEGLFLTLKIRGTQALSGDLALDQVLSPGLTAHQGSWGYLSTKEGPWELQLLFRRAEDLQILPPPLAPEEAARGILVAEDQVPLLRTATEVLEAQGHRVYTARDGLEACQVFLSRQNLIDLVILDLSLPRLDGAQTLHRLRELNPGIPVILASAFAPEDLRLRFSDIPISGFLRKPWSPHDLKTLTDQVLGQLKTSG